MKLPKERNRDVSFRSGSAELQSFLQVELKGEKLKGRPRRSSQRHRQFRRVCCPQRPQENCLSKEQLALSIMLKVVQPQYGLIWLMKGTEDFRRSSFSGNVESRSKLAGNEG